jgi:hypothetical protein
MHGSSYAASIAAAAIIAALTTYFFRRRRNSPPSPPPVHHPVPCPPPPPPALVAGYRLARSHIQSLCGLGFASKTPQVFLLTGSNAAAFDERVRMCVQSQASSSAASSMQTSSLPSMSRISTQHNSRRPLADLLPDAPPPFISAATRAYVAELQNKCVKTAFCFAKVHMT